MKKTAYKLHPNWNEIVLNGEKYFEGESEWKKTT